MDASAAPNHLQLPGPGPGTEPEREPELASSYALPATDSYVHVHVLDGGSFMADVSKLHAGAAAEEKFRLYNWAFYIYHPGLQRKVVWDLGMPDDPSEATPWVQKNMLAHIEPAGPRKPIVQQLAEKHGVAAQDIDAVLFSHAHFDHCRPISHLFPNATAIFGPGTQSHCAPGHLTDPSSQWDGRYFDTTGLAVERWREHPPADSGVWTSFGPFQPAAALDFFGDGSLWILQAPGHMPGNLCAAARLPSGDWVVLGGDCAHSRALYRGEYDFAEFDVGGGHMACLHGDKAAAKETLRKLRLLEDQGGARVVLAHDERWLVEGSDPVLMGLVDEEIRAAGRTRIPKGEVI